MDIGRVLDMASQILDEERASPTVSYQLAVPAGTVSNPAKMLIQTMALAAYGKARPRRIAEDPTAFELSSTNFDLLSSLFERTEERNKEALFEHISSRIRHSNSFRYKHTDLKNAGKWSECSSELPLVAEFLIRCGSKQRFLSSLGKSTLHPGISLLLLHLEELIALNFTAFTEAEYLSLEMELGNLSKSIDAFVHSYYQGEKTGTTAERNTKYHMAHELPELCASVLEECRKARYHHVKAALLPGLNLEVNQDRGAVVSYLEKLGFARDLIESLNEAERLYRTASTGFDLKSSMGHLRSFIETLYIHASITLKKKMGGSPPSKWGEALEVLKDGGVLTLKEQQVVIQLYTLMSDTGVHPLVAEREYVRLMRNVCIEFGLLLLTKLDKLGIT